MTDAEREAVQKALATARREHESRDSTGGQDVINGALIRAVELLAGTFAESGNATANLSEAFKAIEETLPKEDAVHVPGCTGWFLDHGGPFECAGNGSCQVESAETQGPPAKPAAFDDGLVERLARVAYNAEIVPYLAAGENGDKWAERDPEEKEPYIMSVRAILSELAKMPAETPTSADISRCGYPGPLSLTDCIEIETMLRTRLGPVLAAKDARIAELENKWGGEPAREFRNKTAALDESNALMNAANVPYSHLTVERVRLLIEERDVATARITELEKRLANTDAAHKRFIESAANDASAIRQIAQLVRPGMAYVHPDDVVTATRERLAGQSAPVDADGKTPGQVAYEAYLSDYQHEHAGFDVLNSANQAPWGHAATAVLRAFGNGAEARQSTVIALNNARERIGAMVIPSPNELTYNAGNAVRKQARAIIDDELAKLEGAKPRASFVHRMCANAYCGKPEGMHYDDNAKAETCGMFTEVKP